METKKEKQDFKIEATKGMRKYISEISIDGDNVCITGYENVLNEATKTIGPISKNQIKNVSYNSKKLLNMAFKIRVIFFVLIALIGFVTDMSLVGVGAIGIFFSYLVTKSVNVMTIVLDNDEEINIVYDDSSEVKKIESFLSTQEVN